LGLRGWLTLLIGILPHSRFKCLTLGLINGWRIASSARIGPCLLLNVRYLELDVEAILGSCSVYRNLMSVRIGYRSVIGSWNTISSAVEFTQDNVSEAARLTIGRESAITNRHYLDCSGGVSIGDFSTVAGIRSTFLSHSIDLQQSRQRTATISIGDYTFVASNCSIMAGATLPAKCVLAMGAVLRPGADREGLLYAGVPARPVRHCRGEYFGRTVGRVAI
jgi:acetyltransferase-like isoleucine patch superfamily enzyme